jgi:EAL domain-containing protein (putative c-di-GMP-specific phosphodiesterase class I)
MASEGAAEGRKNRRWTEDPPGPAPAESSLPPPIRRLGAAQIDVVFQPIVDLRDGTVFANEALVRCKIEAYRNPLDLLEQATREQAMGRLGRTIRQVTFARNCPTPVFVNIHPDELSSHWLVRPDDPLSETDSPLYLEITEGAALKYFDICSSVLRELCARTGAKLVVDDFGAGYSNLKRVVDLEPAVVKLDRALINGINFNTRQRVLVEYLVKTMSALGAQVVAEGIETPGELAAVRDAGCHYGQGYLLARPAYPIPTVSWPF